MENTNEFVRRMQKNQKKDEKNRQRQGEGNPDEKLPNKRN